MARTSGAKAFLYRARTGCLANLGLKAVSLVIAIIVYVLVRRSSEESPLPHTDPPTRAP